MYNYEEQKLRIFEADAQVDFLKTRDHIRGIIDLAGVITMGEAIRKTSGSSWKSMAFVDRLVELGELVEVEQSPEPAGQYRIFRRPYRH